MRFTVDVTIKLAEHKEKHVVVHVRNVEGILLAYVYRSEYLIYLCLHFFYFFIEEVVKDQRLSLSILCSCNRQEPHAFQLLNPILAVLCYLRKSLLIFSDD